MMFVSAKLMAERAGMLDGNEFLGDDQAWCCLSPCGKYRYLLGRQWNEALPILSCTMLNPSKATHERSDRTVDKVLLIARHEGFGGVVVRNLGAFRATDPKEMMAAEDAVGPLNPMALEMVFGPARVMAWGRLSAAAARKLPTWFQEKRRCTHVFQWTDKEPWVGRHPLYLKNATKLIPIEVTP